MSKISFSRKLFKLDNCSVSCQGFACSRVALCLSVLSMLSGQRARGMRKHFRFADIGQPWRIRNIANKRMKWQEIVIIVAPTLCLRYR